MTPINFRLGIDLDGVLYDWHLDMREWVRISTGIEYPQPTTWNFSEKEWGMSREEFTNHWHEGVRAGHVFRKQPPLTEGVEVLHRLAKDHDLFIITSRLLPGLEDQCRDNTMGWIEEYGIPYDELHLVGHGKSEICTDLEIDIMIDDAIHNYEDIRKNSRTLPVMLTMPWNKDHLAWDRVDSWTEFEAFVTRLATKPY